ncbi:hypothetical protein AGMMS49579_25940 [Spirochaetia bacterium]|nr:hypothetical protein AGMMS49579_25940 [Spirochaetia bacterium]
MAGDFIPHADGAFLEWSKTLSLYFLLMKWKGDCAVTNAAAGLEYQPCLWYA